MIGFIKKDFALMKNNFKIIGMWLIIYILIGLFDKINVTPVLPLISVVLMMNTFSYDYYNKWNAYSVTLPNGRKNSVRAKYITTILISIIVSILNVLICFAISYVNTKSIHYEEILYTLVVILFIAFLITDFMYPMIYKFGIDKARAGLFFLGLIACLIIGLLNDFGSALGLANLMSFIEEHLLIILTVSTVILMYISYKISEKIVNKQDF